MNKKLYPTLAALCLIPVVMVLGNSMLIPVLPLIQKELNLSLVQVNFLISVFSLAAGIVIPFAGILADRIGRKKIIYPALIIYGLGGILAGVFALILKNNAYPYLIFARVIQGIGAGGTYQLGMTLGSDLLQPKERTQFLGIMEASNGLGKIISPLAGAALALLSWSAPFFAYGILAFPAAWMIFSIVKEDLDKLKAQMQPISKYFSNLKQIFATQGISLSLSFLTGLVTLATLFGMLSYFSDQLETIFKITIFSRGLILAIPVLMMSITTYTSGKLLPKKEAQVYPQTIALGLFTLALGVSFFFFAKALLGLIFSLSLVGIGTGTVLTALNTIITSSAGKNERGLVTCLYGTVRFFGVALGPPIFALTETIAKSIIFLPFIILTVITGILALFFIKPSRELEKDLPEKIPA